MFSQADKIIECPVSLCCRRVSLPSSENVPGGHAFKSRLFGGSAAKPAGTRMHSKLPGPSVNLPAAQTCSRGHRHAIAYMPDTKQLSEKKKLPNYCVFGYAVTPANAALQHTVCICHCGGATTAALDATSYVEPGVAESLYYCQWAAR